MDVYGMKDYMGETNNTAEGKNNTETAVNEREKKNEGSVWKIKAAVTIAAAVLIVIACSVFVFNPWNEKSPIWKYVESNIEDEIYWPGKDEFDIIGKNQTGVGMLKDNCIDVSLNIECEYGSNLVFSSNYLKKAKHELIERLDELGTKYAIGLIGDFDNFQFTPGDGYVKYDEENNDSMEETPIPRFIVRISPEGINREIFELSLHGYKSIQIIDLEEIEDEDGLSGKAVYSSSYKSMDFTDDGTKKTLKVIPENKSALDKFFDGDKVGMAVNNRPIFEGIYTGGEFVFDTSYIYADNSMPDMSNEVLKKIIESASRGETIGLSYARAEGIAVGENKSSAEELWGVKYEPDEMERNAIKSLMPELPDAEVKIVYTYAYQKELRVGVYDRDMGSISGILTDIMEAVKGNNLWNSYEAIFVTCMGREDNNEFARIVYRVASDYSKEKLSVITRGEKYSPLADNITEKLISVENLKEYDIEKTIVTNLNDEHSESTSETIEIRTDGKIVSE